MQIGQQCTICSVGVEPHGLCSLHVFLDLTAIEGNRFLWGLWLLLLLFIIIYLFSKVAIRIYNI